MQKIEKLKSAESALKGELSACARTYLLGIEESRISEQLIGLRDANEMLLAKQNTLNQKTTLFKEGIDLMRLELQNMGTNEQSLVLKVRQIDSENQKLLAETSS